MPEAQHREDEETLFHELKPTRHKLKDSRLSGEATQHQTKAAKMYHASEVEALGYVTEGRRGKETPHSRSPGLAKRLICRRRSQALGRKTSGFFVEENALQPGSHRSAGDMV